MLSFIKPNLTTLSLPVFSRLSKKARILVLDTLFGTVLPRHHLLTCILSGQILQFATTFEQIEKISNWSGKDVLFIDRINQFSNFIQSIFIAPSSNIVINKQIPCFWLKEVTTVNIFGIIILSEQLSMFKLIGCILILGAITMLIVFNSKKSPT